MHGRVKAMPANTPHSKRLLSGLVLHVPPRKQLQRCPHSGKAAGGYGVHPSDTLGSRRSRLGTGEIDYEWDGGRVDRGRLPRSSGVALVCKPLLHGRDAGHGWTG